MIQMNDATLESHFDAVSRKLVRMTTEGALQQLLPFKRRSRWQRTCSKLPTTPSPELHLVMCDTVSIRQPDVSELIVGVTGDREADIQM